MHLLPLGLVVVTAHVDSYQDVALVALHAVQGNGVDDTAVDQDHIVALDGFVEGRQGDAGADGLEQTAFVEDDLLA